MAPNNGTNHEQINALNAQIDALVEELDRQSRALESRDANAVRIEKEVRPLLKLVPRFTGQEEVTELGGGLTNRNYRVKASHGRFVLRIAGTGTELLGIDRAREVACSRAAEDAGVGPSVVAYLEEHRTLITAFVQGILLDRERVRQPETLRRVAQTLRRCHDHHVPADLGEFSPFQTIRSYHHLARERNVPLPERLGEALQRFDRIERELQTGEPRCLCHNDLLAANFLDDGESIRIIDWEYGGLGDRFFDLGNFAVNNRLDEVQERDLLRYYYVGEDRPEHFRRLRLMRLVSDLREATWGFLQAGISKLHSPEHYLEYGRLHLERFLAAAERLA
jgi:thiamine kinase-like enzyme